MERVYRGEIRDTGETYAVLSVATQESWMDVNEKRQSRTEWHRVVAFKRLGEALAERLRKGDHVLVEGQLVSRKYENDNGKSKKSKGAKFVTFWNVRASSIKRLTRNGAESPAPASQPGPVAEEDVPF